MCALLLSGGSYYCRLKGTWARNKIMGIMLRHHGTFRKQKSRYFNTISLPGDFHGWKYVGLSLISHFQERNIGYNR